MSGFRANQMEGTNVNRCKLSELLGYGDLVRAPNHAKILKQTHESYCLLQLWFTRMSAGEYLPPSGGREPTVESPARKPRFALFIATTCGLGYIPVAPGTFGSLAGLALALSVYQILAALSMSDF